MMMNKNFLYILVVVSLATLLSACGGGGGGSSDSGGSASPPPSGESNQNISKSFTVNAARVDVRRVSNSDLVDVDTAGIVSTNMTFN